MPIEVIVTIAISIQQFISEGSMHKNNLVHYVEIASRSQMIIYKIFSHNI